MSNKTMSDNACYASCSIPVDPRNNTPNNRMDINLYGHSDTTIVDVFLYGQLGLYWYSLFLAGAKPINSVGFVSLQNCVTSLRDTLRVLGFTLGNADCLARFVRAWNRQGRKVA